jgi:hypothetical protein
MAESAVVELYEQEVINRSAMETYRDFAEFV